MVQYTAITYISAFSMVVMAAAVWSNSFMERDCKRRFLLLFLLLILVNLAEWLAAYLGSVPASPRGLRIAAKFIELTLTPLVPVVSSVSIGGSRHVRWMIIPIGVNLLLQLLSLRFGLVFSVDAMNVYHRGPLYMLYVATYVCGTLFLFVHSYRLSRRYQFRGSVLLFLILLLVLSAIVLQLVVNSLRLDWVCVSIGSMLFYIYYSEQVQQVDALTALLNRRSYDCGLENLQQQAVILFFDVDEFKAANDRYGHPFGDECLTRIAGQIKAVFSRYGHCYRYGGDEFCVIQLRELRSAEKLVSAFLHGMEGLRAEDPRMPRVSVGYAQFEPERESAEDAIRRADTMMYEFKSRRSGEREAAADALSAPRA